MSTLTARVAPLDTVLARLSAWRPSPATLAGSPAWCAAAGKAYGAESLVAVVFERDGALAGVTVLQRASAGWRSGSPGQSCLQWPAQAFGYRFAPCLAPPAHPVPPAPPTAWIDALIAAFPGARLQLSRIDATATATATAPAGMARAFPGPATWCAPISGGLDGWYASLKGEHRRDLGYYRRRIAKAGGVWHEPTTAAERHAALETTFTLHAARVGDKGQQSAFATPGGRRFCHALLDAAAADARLTLLEIDGVCIAGCLAFVVDGGYECYLPGWDPRHRHLDLGRQVIHAQLLAEFGRGSLRRIDLLGGDLAYKREFGLSPLPTIDVVVPPSRAALVREGLVRGALDLYRRMVRT